MKDVLVFCTLMTALGWLLTADNSMGAIGAFLMAGIIPGIEFQLPWFVMLGGSLALLLVLILRHALYLYIRRGVKVAACALLVRRHYALEP